MNPLYVTPLVGCEPEVGRWLWGLQEVRRKTLALVDGIDQRTLDWEGPDGHENAVGTLLHHIALVEASWLFLDVLQRQMPDTVGDLFSRAPSPGRLVRTIGIPLSEHLERLHQIRQHLIREFSTMTPMEWRRLRAPVDRSDYEVTPEWATFHLIEHEAGHAFQISSLSARAARYFGNGL